MDHGQVVPMAAIPIIVDPEEDEEHEAIPIHVQEEQEHEAIAIQVRAEDESLKNIDNAEIVQHPHHLEWLLLQGYNVDSVPTKRQNIIFDDEFYRRWIASDICSKIYLILIYFISHQRYLSIILFPISSIIFLLVLYFPDFFSSSPTQSNDDRLTLLHLAIVAKRNDSVSVLLNYHANLHAKMSNGNNALLASVYALDINIVKSIIAHNPNYSFKAADGSTALGIAVDNNRQDIARVLLEGGANPDQLSKGVAPLEIAVIRKLHAVVQVMIDVGHANPNITTTAGETLLMKAVCDGDERIIEYLLRGNANSDFPSRGIMPLVRAILDDKIEVVKLILRYPINMSYQDENGNSYLMIANNEHMRRIQALRQGQNTLFQRLLDFLNDLVPFPIPEVIRPRVDPNLRNNKGRTVMMELVVQEYFAELLHYFVDARIDWKLADNDRKNVADYLLTSKIPSALYIVFIRAIEPRAINIENYDNAMKLYPVVGNCQNVNEICGRLWILRQANVNLNVDCEEGNVWVWLMESFINEECNCDLVHFLRHNKCDTRLLTSFKHDNGDNVLMRIIRTVKNVDNFTRSILIFLIEEGIDFRQRDHLGLNALTMKPANEKLGEFLRRILIDYGVTFSDPTSIIKPEKLLLKKDQYNYLVFLSHHKLDGNDYCETIKYELIESLEIDESQIFFDKTELDNLKNLPKCVQSSACFIFVWTKDILTRPWCLYELSIASRYNKVIIPLVVDESLDTVAAIASFRNTFNADKITSKPVENKDFLDVVAENGDTVENILRIVDYELGKMIHKKFDKDRWIDPATRKFSAQAVRSYWQELLKKIEHRLPKQKNQQNNNNNNRIRPV